MCARHAESAMSRGYKRIGSRQQGALAEKRYKRAAPDARKSSKEEDMYMHVDFWHDDQGVDVKGNNVPDEIWLEMKNVRGDRGWLFGEATTIAFDMPELTGFVVVDREELAKYCRDNVDFSCLVAKDEAYKRCYQRRDRKDLITKLVLSDLEVLESYTVLPYCTSYSHPEGGVRYVRYDDVH